MKLKALIVALILACASAYGQYRDATGTTTATILDIRGTATAPALAPTNYARCYLDTSSTPTLKCSISGGGFLNWIGSGGGGGGGAVASVFGRTGAVTSQNGDYQGSQIAVAPPGNGITATNVQTALEQLATRSGAVTAVFGRSGSVSAQTGDYSASQITSSPTGDVSSTNVQAAIAELAAEKISATTTSSFTGPKTFASTGTPLSIQPGVTPAANTKMFDMRTALGVSNFYVDSEGDTTLHDLNVTGAVSGIAFPVTSVFGRTGAIVAASGDYSAFYPPLALTISTGTGLSGGGDLSANRTLSLANTSVTPGSYTNTNITVDAQGRITAASNGAGGNVTSVFGRTGVVTAQSTDYSSFYPPTTRAINTGTGLSGGGDLSADRTLGLANTAVTPGSYTNANITVDAQGRLTSASNGSASAVTSVFGRTGAVTAQSSDYASFFLTPTQGNTNYGQLAAANSWTAQNTFTRNVGPILTTARNTTGPGTISVTISTTTFTTSQDIRTYFHVGDALTVAGTGVTIVTINSDGLGGTVNAPWPATCTNCAFTTTARTPLNVDPNGDVTVNTVIADKGVFTTFSTGNYNATTITSTGNIYLNGSDLVAQPCATCLLSEPRIGLWRSSSDGDVADFKVTTYSTQANNRLNVSRPSDKMPGRLSVVSGGNSVSGNNTTFMNTFNVGDTFTIYSGSVPLETYTIAAISDDETMTTVETITTTRSSFEYAATFKDSFSAYPNGNVTVGRGITLNTAQDAKPTCSSSIRGTFWYQPGAGGVKDNVQVCAKDAADAYAWRTIY